VNLPLKASNQPLKIQLRKPELVMSNNCMPIKADKAKSLILLACYKALDFLNMNHKKVRNEVSINLFSELLQEELQTFQSHIEVISSLNKEMIQRIAGYFWRSASLSTILSSEKTHKKKVLFEVPQCPATVSVVGSIASQEVIKAVTGTLTPVKQFLFFESFDSLHLSYTQDSFNHDASDMEKIYGKQIMEEIRSLRIFIVGSGAIGCELLKNLALMGVSEGSAEGCSDAGAWGSLDLGNGGVLLTDMDSIELSNLNRQLLFREKHVGRFKSKVAQDEIKKINPSIKIKALIERVADDSSAVTPEIWRQADVILNALDNVDARLFVDSQCVRHGRWLLDSGTLGTKGNVQVSVIFDYFVLIYIYFNLSVGRYSLHNRVICCLGGSSRG
jgi:hypothetical protein